MRQDTYKVASNPVITYNEHMNVLFAGESQTKPSHQRGPKVYDFYLMHTVLEGKGEFTCGGKSYSLRAGNTFLIEPEQLVSYSSDADEPWLYRWVAFNGPQAVELVQAAGFSVATPVNESARIRRIAALYHHIFSVFRKSQPAAHIQAAGYLQLLLAEFCSVHQLSEDNAALTHLDDTEKLMQQMIHYLSTQYAQPVSIEQMAESFGYNRAYLSRIFKRYTGETPITFLLKLRIDKARQMIREREGLTIEQIAASVGLQDSLYFSKQFRRLYGQSPSAYRESVRQMKT
ncbi:AraC family transcriptional regulator [Paenibacillus glycanilyticus]|uniref:AraC family transcriptional regulator n=1 Tax=Paenibacillus glycanilyticus TaxID=126569 RepID=A0ABQ6G8E0_9BACL|nr:AraC family transcriptional regulator [Paenibacillus glycanilyticus]GLX66280.1 AraC family transcriptional regulator [Paenibacillus glycanilyticus]